MFRERVVSPAELDGNIVEPARSKSPIEMAQPRNDHANHRHADIRARLIEDKKIEAVLPAKVHAGECLFTGGQAAEI